MVYSQNNWMFSVPKSGMVSNLSQADKVPYFELSTLVWPFCSQYLIYLLILLTVCHTNPLMLVQRIRYWINRYPLNWYISLFPSFFLMVSSWYCKEKFCLGHPRELNIALKQWTLFINNRTINHLFLCRHLVIFHYTVILQPFLKLNVQQSTPLQSGQS